jgi:hypothetical protein
MRVLAWVLASALGMIVPTVARADLQGCPGAQAMLPIGHPSQRLYNEKNTLRTWIGMLSPSQFEWSTATPHFLEPVVAYGGSPAAVPGGGACPANLVLPALSFTDVYEIERTFVLFDEMIGTYAWDWATLSLAPEAFTLAGMEDVGNCEERVPQLGWDPMMTWMANWGYAGNPYHTDPQNREALLLRGAAWLAEQLILLDYEHVGEVVTALPSNTTQPQPGFTFVHPPPGQGPSGSVNHYPDLAGMLGVYAFTWSQVRPLLVQQQRLQEIAAIETLLRMYSERLDAWNNFGMHANRFSRSAWATALLQRTSPHPTLANQYNDRVIDMYDPAGWVYRPAGHLFDDGGYDSSYNGWNLLYLTHILYIDPTFHSPLIDDAAGELATLRAHLLLQDPDGTWTSPNAFNSRTGGNSLGGTVGRTPRQGTGGHMMTWLAALAHGVPYAHAFLRDAELIGPQSRITYPSPYLRLDPSGPDFHKELLCQMNGRFSYINTAIGAPRPLDDLPNQPGSGSRTGFYTFRGTPGEYSMPRFVVSEFDPNLLRDWWDQRNQQPDLELFPFEEDGPYVRSLDDEFIYVKMGQGQPEETYVAMVHAGPVSPGDSDVGGNQFVPTGFGGGQLTSYWAPDGGAFVRSMRRGYNNPNIAFDEFSQWRSWAIHAVSMLSYDNGTWTSSSRIHTPGTRVALYDKPIPRGDLRAALSRTTDTCFGDEPMPIPVFGTTTNQQELADAVLVRVCGAIPTAVRTLSVAPPPALSAPLPYARVFYMGPRDMFVATTIRPEAAHSGDLMAEAWETFPLHDHHLPETTYGPMTIWLHAPGVGAVDGSQGAAPVAGVTSVTVKRANATMRILFDTPQVVGVSDEILYGAGDTWTRNLLIDLLGGLGPDTLQPTTVTYRIEVMPTDDGGGGPFGDGGLPSDK